jgi:hypothetical protein
MDRAQPAGRRCSALPLKTPINMSMRYRRPPFHKQFSIISFCKNSHYKSQNIYHQAVRQGERRNTGHMADQLLSLRYRSWFLRANTSVSCCIRLSEAATSSLTIRFSKRRPTQSGPASLLHLRRLRWCDRRLTR